MNHIELRIDIETVQYREKTFQKGMKTKLQLRSQQFSCLFYFRFSLTCATLYIVVYVLVRGKEYSEGRPQNIKMLEDEQAGIL
jgi:hypothetical protein